MQSILPGVDEWFVRKWDERTILPNFQNLHLIRSAVSLPASGCWSTFSLAMVVSVCTLFSAMWRWYSPELRNFCNTGDWVGFGVNYGGEYTWWLFSFSLITLCSRHHCWRRFSGILRKLHFERVGFFSRLTGKRESVCCRLLSFYGDLISSITVFELCWTFSNLS